MNDRGALLAATVIATAAVALLLWFPGYLRAALELADGDSSALATVTVAAWVALFVIASVGAAWSVAIIWRGADTVDPQLVRLSFDVEKPLAVLLERRSGAAVSARAMAGDLVDEDVAATDRGKSVPSRSPSISSSSPVSHLFTGRTPPAMPPD